MRHRSCFRSLLPSALLLLVPPFLAVGCTVPSTKTPCGDVPGLVSPLGDAQVDLANAMRPIAIDPQTGRLDARSVAALPAWIDAPQTRLVALGEATHGTRQVNDARAAVVLELAAQSRGTLVFLLEDEFVRGSPLDRYLAGDGDDAATGLDALRAGVWKNRELAVLMERLRAINASVGVPRVVFRGVDMQDTQAIHEALAYSATALGADAGAELAALKADFETYIGAFERLIDAYDTNSVVDYAPTATLRKKILADLGRVRAHFERAPAAGLSQQERARHLLTVRVAEQNAVKADPLANIQMIVDGDETVKPWLDRIVRTVSPADLAPDPSETRDRAIAENAEAILAIEGADARGILWAHNGHAACGAVNDSKVAGGYLRDRLGEGYRVLGTEFYAGSFRSASPDGRPGVFSIKSSPATFFANAAARLCVPMGIIDLCESSGALAAAFATPFDFNFIGAVYSPDYAPMQVTPAAAFDGIIFIRDTTASEPLSK
jgi:erythromycin esterase-like protein